VLLVTGRLPKPLTAKLRVDFRERVGGRLKLDEAPLGRRSAIAVLSGKPLHWSRDQYQERLHSLHFVNFYETVRS
jgi:hypothetical protein